jgi:hypothetical protein
MHPGPFLHGAVQLCPPQDRKHAIASHSDGASSALAATLRMALPDASDPSSDAANEAGRFRSIRRWTVW